MSGIICRLLAYAPRYMEEPFIGRNKENTGSTVGKIKGAALNVLSERAKWRYQVGYCMR